MPLIPEEIIEDIRHRADIVDIVGSYVPLKKRGADYWACCPFHREKTPSFKVSAERQAFYCFGCKKSGNVFTFVQEQDNVDFVGAVRLLAQRLGIRIPEPGSSRKGEDSEATAKRRRTREEGYELLEQIAAWYHKLLLDDPRAEAARRYVADRGLDAAAVNRFGLGYAPDGWDGALQWGKARNYDAALMLTTGMAIQREGDSDHCYDRFRNRLMFPIRDELSRVVGFSARILVEDKNAPKYVNTPETELFRKNRLLYGLHLARQAFKESGCALVCEGQLDVIACHRSGLTHAVSAQGTAFTENHARLLRRSTDTVVLAFDADAAGEKAAVRSMELLFAAGLETKVVVLPTGEDPDSIFQRRGAAALTEALGEAREAVPYLLDLARRTHDGATARGKSRVVDDVLAVLTSLPDAVARAAHCQWLSRQLGLPEAAVMDAMNMKLKAQRNRSMYRRETQAQRMAPLANTGLVVSSPREGALAMLLDLALNSESAARRILLNLPAEKIPSDPVGRALNLVLAYTQQDEWALAGEEVVGNSEWVAHPDVGRALNDPEFGDRARDEAAPEAEKRRLLAVDDCVRQLLLAELEERIQTNQQAQSMERDAGKARELMEEFVTLQQRKRGLLEPA